MERRARDVTPEMYAKYRKNWPSYVKQINKDITVNQLSDDGGAEIYHCHVKFPWPVSDRTAYLALWNEVDGDDLTIISTTEGNEHIVEANKDKTRKNVLITTHVCYEKIYFDSQKVCRKL